MNYLAGVAAMVLALGCAGAKALKNPGVERTCVGDTCYIYLDEQQQVTDKCTGARGNKGKWAWNPKHLRLDNGHLYGRNAKPAACTFYRHGNPKHKFFIYLWRYDPIRREAHENCHIEVWRDALVRYGNGNLGDHSVCDGFGDGWPKKVL